MWRSKKLIIGAVLVAVLLLGSLGGVALAQTGGEEGGAFLEKVCEIYEENTGESINCTALKESFAEARGEMQAEHPEGRPHYAPMTQVFGSLGYDQEAVQTAFEQARAELEDGTLEGGRGAVMARVLEILEIDKQDWQAACAGEADGERPFKRGFPGMHRMRGSGGPCAPAP